MLTRWIKHVVRATMVVIYSAFEVAGYPRILERDPRPGRRRP